jgi:hypothetical protein
VKIAIKVAKIDSSCTLFRMRSKVLIYLAILGLPLITACTKSDPGTSPEEAKYKSCLEDETSKLLDETGSNFESARASALEACAQLEPNSITK